MKIAILQSDLFWEDAVANRMAFNRQIEVVDVDTELIVLPEMFTTGFSMEPKSISETMDGDTVRWMQNIAFDRKCAIAGSVIIEAREQYFNRLLFVYPNKTVDFYDKRHLFSLAGEHEQFSAGQLKSVVSFGGFRICLQICYDLRFPVFARNTGDYDVLLYVANWPVPRIAAWDALLRARAIENMSHVVGVNRVGFDANNNQYCGHSQVVDFFGNYLIEPHQEAGIFYATLNKNDQNSARQKFGFLNDADAFRLL